MTYMCYICSQGFGSSAALIQHMKISHSRDVAHAEYKIYQTRPDEPLTSSEIETSGAFCPYCQQNCSNSKQLKAHLESEHFDDDKEDEPKVKLIKLPQTTSHSVIDKLNNGQSGLSLTSDPRLVQHLLSVFQNDNLHQAEIDRVASGEVKLPEKKYTCFWCEATFRKRGKLMDHIDMFHKANKQQTAAQATRIQSSGKAVTKAAQTLVVHRQNSVPDLSSANSIIVPFGVQAVQSVKMVSTPMGITSPRQVVTYSKSDNCAPASTSKCVPPTANTKLHQLIHKERNKVSTQPKPLLALSTKSTNGSHELAQTSPYNKVCIFTLEATCRKRRSETKQCGQSAFDKCKFIYKQQLLTICNEQASPTDGHELNSNEDSRSKTSCSLIGFNHHQNSQQSHPQQQEQRLTTSSDFQSKYPITHQIAPALSYPPNYTKDETMLNVPHNFRLSSAREASIAPEFNHSDFNLGLLYPHLLFKPSLNASSNPSSYQTAGAESQFNLHEMTNHIYRNSDIPLDLSKKQI